MNHNQNGSIVETSKESDPEYESLREEIIGTMKSETNVMSLSISATIIILGFNLNISSPKVFIFFAPVIILSVVIIQITQGHLGIIQIATYIRLMFEKGKDKNWESWMSYYREVTVKEIGEKSSTKRLDVLTRRLIGKFITTFDVLKEHIITCILTEAICILYGIRYGWLQYRNSLSGVNPSGSFDLMPCLFVIVLVISLILWTGVAYYALNALRPSNVYKREKKYENKLRNWLLFDRKFEYIAENSRDLPGSAMMELNEIKNQLKSIRDEIIESTANFTLMYKPGSHKIKVENADPVLFGKVKGLLPTYSILE